MAPAPSGQTAAIGESDEPRAFGVYVARPSEPNLVRSTNGASPLIRLSVQLAETCSLVHPSSGGGPPSPPVRRVLTKPSKRAASRCAFRPRSLSRARPVACRAARPQRPPVHAALGQTVAC
eukprot:scaffold17933_cov93-Isochrysis_galbana.AAC.2